MGVLPAPYVDNGIEIDGTHWFGYTLQLDYAAYAVGGLRGDNDGLDIDFIQQRAALPLLRRQQLAAGRAADGSRARSTSPTATLTFTIGASGMWGWYDPNHELSLRASAASTSTRASSASSYAASTCCGAPR